MGEFEKKGHYYFKVTVSQPTSRQHYVEKIIGVPTRITTDVTAAADHAHKYWNHLGYDIHSIHHIKTT